MNFQEKINSLPEDIKAYFVSNTPRIEFETICFLYNISENNIQEITEPIGLLFFKDKSLAELPKIIQSGLRMPGNISYGIAYEINKRIFNKFPEYFTDSTELLEQWARLKSAPLISADEAWKKVLEAEPWILENEKEEQEEQRKEKISQQAIQANLTESSIFDAMKNYPEIGEQLITAEKIQLKNFPEPVRPSIKNWLADYTFTIGFDNKDSIKRGNYLFHNANTSRLSSDDRQKLAHILKAYDEGAPITVDKSMKQIIFSTINKVSEQKKDAQVLNSKFKTSPTGRQVSNQFSNPNNQISKSSASLHNTLSYSSPQKLPYEKAAIPQTAKFQYYQKPWQTAPANNVVRLEPKPAPPRELPKNVVNLRDK